MFTGKVIQITGAAHGLGRALALQFAKLGARIAAVDFDSTGLKAISQTLESLGTEHHVESGDVTIISSIQEATNRCLQRLGSIDIHIANAGIGLETPCSDFDPATFQKLIDVNLIGVANSIASVLPVMIQRRAGHLVAISSLASYRGLPNMAGYCASKAGVSVLMDSMRVELKPLGIACTTVCPGWINTRLTHHFAFPMPGLLSIEDAVRHIIKAVERKQAYLAFPLRSHWPLALNRILPTKWGDYILRWVLRKQGLQKGL